MSGDVSDGGIANAVVDLSTQDRYIHQSKAAK